MIHLILILFKFYASGVFFILKNLLEKVMELDSVGMIRNDQ